MNKFSFYSPALQATDWYECFKYPAGELQVRVKAELVSRVRNQDEAILAGRIYSSDDFFELMLLTSAIEGLGVSCKKVVLPYLPYSRADRRFLDGDCSGMETMCDLISRGRRVYTLDVHNEKALGAYTITNCDPSAFIQSAITHTATRADSDDVTVLFPDQGARDRYANVGNTGNNHHEIRVSRCFCSKKRDAVTGKLLGFEVPELPRNRPVLIVDDICDGGGTFLGISERLREQGLNYSLYTTHSMYSRGTQVLYDAGFDYLYTTNSFYRQTYDSPGKMVVYDCIPRLLESVAGGDHTA